MIFFFLKGMQGGDVWKKNIHFNLIKKKTHSGFKVIPCATEVFHSGREYFALFWPVLAIIYNVHM